jgi:hypothetical protein
VDEDTKQVQPGLSFSGVKWIANSPEIVSKHPLSIEHIEIVESPDGKTWRANAMCKDLATSRKLWGSYEQSKMMKIAVRDSQGKKVKGDYIEKSNPFSYSVASSKAQRNALRQLLPEPVIIAMYKQWKKNKLSPTRKDVTPSKESTQEAEYKEVPPAARDTMRKKVEDDIKDFGGMVNVVDFPDGLKIEIDWNSKDYSATKFEALTQILGTYDASRGVDKGTVFFRIKV